ncbi:hypothetical protein [Limnobaculum xujianqingii]|uniref:hypothetical protein n=1 Tax=Limnobaculum xujianqingii TaxID=2738837 RepID=UPI00112E2AC0|nr:hypothetical protein [Limnobaculum xujianqingii]
MALITKEEADSKFNQYYPVFTSVFSQVWNGWLLNSVAHRLMDKRARAAILRNDALFFLNDEIETSGLSDIKYIKLRHQTGFLIQDKYFVRIKKGDKNFRSSNYPTQAAMDFHDPNVDLFGGLVRLELLYILSDDGVQIDKIVLTQRNGKYVAWAIDLSNYNVHEMPENNNLWGDGGDQKATQVKPAKSVVKAKRTKTREAKIENGRGD